MKFKCFCVFILIISCFKIYSQENYKFDIDFNKIIVSQDAKNQTNTKSDNSDFVFAPASEADFIQFADLKDSVNWENSKYLVCNVWHDNPFSTVLYFNFYKKNARSIIGVNRGEQALVNKSDSAHITFKVGILPFLKTQVIFPLSYLDGQHVFLERFPRQLKGFIFGHRLKPSDVAKIQLTIYPVHDKNFRSKVNINSLYLSSKLPNALDKLEKPIIDEFGQWAAKEWKGKTKNEEQLSLRLKQQSENINKKSFPKDWSSFGGWKEKSFQATGFFRTEHDGKRWWLVDPEGYAFLSAGIDCITPGADGAIAGNEDLFEKLPPFNEQYRDCYTYNKTGDLRTVDYYKSNFIRVFGNEWRTKWEDITSGLLFDNRINTIANWSDINFAKRSGIPYVLQMKSFPSTNAKLFRDFPDVYDSVFVRNAKIFAEQLNSYKNDPYLIGYFLVNEPHWAFGEFNLAYEMFATNQLSYTKKFFVEWIKSQYNSNLAVFNNEWNMSLRAFEDLELKVLTDEQVLSEKARKQLLEFSGIMVDKLVSTVCEEVKKVDPNHLNLGMRYANISSELCYRAGNYFDVFSVNGYTNPAPPPTSEISERSGKPVIIGEFHFGSTDRGLPANGIQGAESQKARGQAYRYYVENGFARPEIIGIHYFQWIDQPVQGRFDGENYNIGLVDICNKPYKELTDAIRLSHERMYKVANGQELPYKRIIKKVPQICY